MNTSWTERNQWKTTRKYHLIEVNASHIEAFTKTYSHLNISNLTYMNTWNQSRLEYIGESNVQNVTNMEKGEEKNLRNAAHDKRKECA